MEQKTQQIEKILSNVKLLVRLYENNSWLKKASGDSFKNVFKLCVFIEKAVESFNSNGCKKKFLQILEEWLKTNSISGRYSFEFFERCCDRMLENVIRHKAVSFNNCDLGLRMYISMLPQNRLEQFLSTLILESSSLKAFEERIDIDDVDVIELEARVLLHELNENKEKNDIKRKINSMLYSHEILKSFKVVFFMLKVNEDAFRETQNLIFDAIQHKFMDRSVLSHEFWMFLFKTIDKEDIVIICKKYKFTTEFLLNFLLYIGSRMKFNASWKIDEDISEYTEINYDDILEMVRTLCKLDEDIKNSVITKLTENMHEFLVWKSVLRDI